ncbi:MAG TPA: leucyl/phenylalanyl-tRNA--protein transferase [Acidimicrobiia bacterium]|nr:leucyl/phenylalanyl-tRNA--protein transferase [Acidimicrobiia bacterium]
MPAIEPEPTRFRFPSASEWPEDDLVAIGADLEPGTILAAYRRGLFPMPLQDGTLGWWSPLDRAILPFSELRISRSLARSCRRFTVSVDADANGVIEGCADPSRPHGWITPAMRDAYVRLHRLGWVHSFEVWDDDELVGGLYGVAIGGLFCGESMFHRSRDASKVALVHLVSLLSERGGVMLDIQWLTPHLESLGGKVIGRDAYLERLPQALAVADPFEDLDLDEGWP